MIYFHLSKKYFDHTRLENKKITPQLNAEFAGDYFLNGPMAWCLQTFIHLRSAGYPCQLVEEFPNEGIIITAYRDVPFFFKPSRTQFFVSIREDGYYNPYANVNISQNQQQCKDVRNSYYVPFWAQYGLIPRDVNRGDRFENAAFFGYEINIDSALRSQEWIDFLYDKNMSWKIIGSSASDVEKINYSDVDVIIAARSFSSSDRFLYKPANKLINSWLAGVPAILGNESAFQAIRKSELDYLPVSNMAETKHAVVKLRADKDFRNRMIANGHLRAEEFSTEKITESWIKLLDRVIVPGFREWRSISEMARLKHMTISYLQLKKKGLLHRINRS